MHISFRLIYLLGRLAIAATIAACASSDERLPSFAAFPIVKSSTLVWQGGTTYKHYVYGRLEGSYEVTRITKDPVGDAVYEFHATDTQSRTMPAGYMFNMTVPKVRPFASATGGGHATCDMCTPSGYQTFLASEYFVDRS